MAGIGKSARRGESTGTFSLPMLLSFNELAWIAIFGMAVFCAFAANRLTKLKDTAATLETRNREIERLTQALDLLAAKKAGVDAKLGENESSITKLNLEMHEAKKDAEELIRLRRELASLRQAHEKTLADDRERGQKLSSVSAELVALKRSIPSNFPQILAEWQQVTGRTDDPTARDAAKEKQRAEFSIRQELIGIRANNLRRVIILFDTSSSMMQSNAWEDAKRLVRTWLNYLPIEECVLVNFDSSVNAFPRQGYLRLRGNNGEVIAENHKQLMATFDSITGGALTDTLAALEKAYSYPDATMILLFSDGAPVSRFRSFDKLRPVIFDLIKRHGHSVPINTIGLGNYEIIGPDDVAARANIKLKFLKDVARASGGYFIAR